ncbi:general transcription factor 3C polypeptide 5 [Cocos nucifera]|uniref:General transcription factor 3C polypeptide 5 n=1 Tax=Cocos nucifera TaxID=13894 RepID=A0A8K0IS04_COCNU|nr:general transcription factor 3C polypeptide 5 [Cocos nucifera]
MDPPDDDRPKPSTSSVVKDGAVSGVLPAAEAFAIHYPGYPSSTERAIETLGGLPEVAKVRSSETGAMELRFRPEDPYCHPAFGNLHPSSSLLLKISKSRAGTEQSSGETGGGAEGSVGEANGGGREGTPAPAESLLAEVVARCICSCAGMVDYQHVLAVHAAEERRKKRPWALEGEMDIEEDVNSGIDGADVMMLVPPLFSLKDRPETIVVPIKINWEDNILKDTTEWEWQMAVCKLFEERPIWPRWSLHERLLEDGLDVSENQLKRLLFRAGYYFSTGPFGRFWIRKGYDPRTDPESRMQQMLRGNQKVLSKLGWFSMWKLRTLRLHVRIRFLSLYPNGAAECLLQSARELYERSKKEEVFSRFQKPEKEAQHFNGDPNCSAEVPCTESKEHEQEDQDGPNNCVVEDEEEEEEELDGYEYPPVVREDGYFPVDGNSCILDARYMTDKSSSLLVHFVAFAYEVHENA